MICISKYLFNSFFRQQTFANWFLSLFELLLLLSFAKSFPKFFGFPNLENCAIHLFHSLLPLQKRIHQGLTALILFVSLLPFSKEQRTNCLNSFVSLFSLVKEFNKTQSENSFDSSLSHKKKDYKGLTTWEFFCFPIHKVSKD